MGAVFSPGWWESLRSFGEGNEDLSASEISRLAGLPMSTCHRILAALVEQGLLEKGAEGRYHVGLVLWEVASHAPRSVGVQRLALPFMRDLSEITHYPVHLAVREGLESVFIERLAPTDSPFERPRVGSRYPLHVTSVGLDSAGPRAGFGAGLASSPVRSGPTRPYTEDVIPYGSGKLAEIRAQGFAVSDRQVVLDAISVAAPIRDWTGAVVAAISVNTPLGRLREQSAAHAVQTAALGITRSWQRSRSSATVAGRK